METPENTATKRARKPKTPQVQAHAPAGLALSDVYTVERLAECLGVQPRTLAEHLRAGRMRGHKALGRWYVLAPDALAYITSGADGAGN